MFMLLLKMAGVYHWSCENDVQAIYIFFSILFLYAELFMMSLDIIYILFSQLHEEYERERRVNERENSIPD